MTLIEFWRKYYPGENHAINLVVREGKPAMWLRRTPEWMYLCDANGDFRAAGDKENLFQVVTDWLNSIKADHGALAHFCHQDIVRNIRFEKEKSRWMPADDR